MLVSIGVKRLLDLPQWRPLAPAIAAWSANGMQMVGDMRNGTTRHPFFYTLQGNTSFYAYNPVLDEWLQLGSPALTSALNGACAVFHPTQGPRGVLAAGNTTSSVVLSTALPSAVGIDQLANRGDGVGFTIRIIGNASSGSSGLVAEAVISGNTGGTTPTITLSAPLTWIPQTGDAYEILSGRVFLLGGSTAAAGIWKYYDIATNFFSGNLAFTNLPATVTTDSNLIALSEGHVPYNLTSGQGFYGSLRATATATGSITGQVSTGDFAAAANQWRNFQVRVVSDTTTPTSVGQRRRISGNTAGPSPVYSLYSNWIVTPSTSAVFVVENDDDKIILWSSNSNATYNYNIAANTWDTTTWAAPGLNRGASGNVSAHAFGIVPQVGAGALNSQIYGFRGGSSALDVFDIAGGATGTWSTTINYGNNGSITYTTGTSGAYDPWINQGRYLHININGTNRHARLDLLNRVLEPEAYLRFPTSTALVGGRMACAPVVDGGVNVMSQVYEVLSNQQYLFCLPVLE